MKISNEIKVGAAALITLTGFILLFNFLKGKDVFRTTAVYYSVYNQAGGLEESSPVEVNGHKVGIVQSIDFLNPESGKLLVTYSLRKDFKIPVNTIAEIVPVSILGGMKVRLLYGQGPGFYSNGDTIAGTMQTALTDRIETELVPVKEKITGLITSIDTMLYALNEIMDENFRNDLKSTVNNINGATGTLDRVLLSREKELINTLSDLNKFSGMLADNSQNIGRTLTNFAAISDTLAAADIYGTISNLKKNLEETSRLLAGVNKGKGSAGQLITDDSLYINLSGSLASLNLLLGDMKANPRRYVHFSLFGKKE